MYRLRRDEAALCVATTDVPERHAAPLPYAFRPGFSGDSGDFSPNATTPGRRLPPAHCGHTAHSRYDETVRCRSRGWNVAGQPVLAWRDTRKGASLLAMRVHMADFRRASEVPGRLRVPVGHRVRHVTAVRFMRRLPGLPPRLRLHFPCRAGLNGIPPDGGCRGQQKTPPGRGFPLLPSLSINRCRGSCAAARSGSGDAACAAPWLRSGGYARG